MGLWEWFGVDGPIYTGRVAWIWYVVWIGDMDRPIFTSGVDESMWTENVDEW